MRAALCTAYGGPETVILAEQPLPELKTRDILIRVRTTTVSIADCRVRGRNFPRGFALLGRLIFGIKRPRRPVLGVECAGIIEAVGSSVSRFQPGEAVFAATSLAFGCHAEFVRLREDGAIAPMPQGFSFEQAAAVCFGGATALHFLRGPGKLERGERLLVNGAGGAVGSAAVQLGKHFGAHVTAVCSNSKAGLVRSLGADAVIDYAATDFTAGGESWDVILDAAGTLGYAKCRAALKPGGRLLLAAASLPDLLKAPFQSAVGDHKVAGGGASERAEDLLELKRLCEAGAFTPVIDSHYRFGDIAKAHARADSGHKAGSVIVTMDETA